MMDNKDQIRIARSVAVKLAFEVYVEEEKDNRNNAARWELARQFTTYILTGTVPAAPVKEEKE